MDFGSKLEELNLTRDEMNRFGEALKDETFRELLREYAAEIADPENRRRYEQEITQMEQERGVHAQFIHPEPHHVLKTRSARGKTFINICSNPRIDEPSCEAALDRGGKSGHNWRLPFSLTPGRADRDAAGNSCVVYDVVFHPDALRMAEKSVRFMKLIHSTAVGGIQDSFHIQLDQLKQLKMRYKGPVHPAVIRRPIPGHHQNQSAAEGMLPIPDPDEKPKEPKASPPEDPRPKQPIRPHFTLKYRSVVDLQDYRCSRDSGPGARPREIVIIIDMPLLGSAQEAELRVTGRSLVLEAPERSLVLETPEPLYRLELTLAYPVDEEKGHAKFNTARKQLTITLPVRRTETPELPPIGCDGAKRVGLDPDHTEDLNPDHTEENLNPDHTEENLNPDHTEENLNPDLTEEDLNPDHTEDLNPDLTEEDLNPDLTEENLNPDLTEENLNPNLTEENLNPDLTEEDLNPDLTEEDLNPDHTEDLNPDHTEENLNPNFTEDLNPDHTEEDLNPDHTEEDLNPDHREEGLDPDHTEEALDRFEDDMNIERAVDSSSHTSSVSGNSGADTLLLTDENTQIHTWTPTHLQEREKEGEREREKAQDGERESGPSWMEDAGIRSEEPALTAAFCFQNTLRFDLD
ncbi:protein kintoun [Pseudorasbora parva]|uniref:protein kintoun n=1 Tax=Pseudorasbora parva TaxID=51549 RepID=UPI00351F60E7